MAFDILEFRAAIGEKGVLKNNRFIMVLNPPASILVPFGQFTGGIGPDEAAQNQYAAARLQFQIQGTQLPGMQIATHQFRRFGYGPFENKPYVTVFSDINMEVLSDGEGYTWRLLQRWCQSIINSDFRNNSAVGPNALKYFEVAFKNQYAVDTELWIFNEADPDQPKIKVYFYQMFPVFVADTPLNWGDKNTLLRIPTTWTFYTWTADLPPVYQNLSLNDLLTLPL